MDMRPPASIRSCGSQPYVSSVVHTGSAWPSNNLQEIVSMRSYSNASEFVRTFKEIPSVEEALSTLDRAAQALAMKRLREALKLYMEGGYSMANAAEHQSHPKIRNLLTSKGFEMINWCGRLCDVLEGRVQDLNPRPGVHKIGIPVDNFNDEWQGPEMLEEEYDRIWYTPVYCPKAVDFTAYSHRLRCGELGRRPKLMICVTIYNEGPDQLKLTLRKLGNNLIYLKNQQPRNKELEGFAGDNFWQDVLICIVADGRENVHEKMLEYLSQIGLYDEDLMTIQSAGIGPNCHMFEHTLQLTVNNKHLPPIQAVFAMKEQKASKLDSHNWFFNAFAEQVHPEYTILMDVGTMPTKSALYNMLYAFENNKQIGGACGQLAVEDPFKNLSNWVVSAQHFEYKISNILDKSLESCFGFISVLPGAFSGYRYQAIRGPPLEAYFHTLDVDLDVLGPFYSNMYLAEDRVLCFELLARKDCRWTMHYVKDAVARTDVPHDLVSLIWQRRRWLNGAFFATLFSIWNWGRVYSESSHSFLRKFFLLFFYVYHVANTIFAFVLPANVYLALYFIVFQGFQQNRLRFMDTSKFTDSARDSAVYVFNSIYAIGLLMLLIIGLGNNPKHMKFTYYFVGALFGALMMVSSLVALGVFFSTDSNTDSILLAVFTVGVYFIGSALQGEVHHILLTFTHYTALIPSFVNIFTMYSFCNLQDLSWGTKGLNQDPVLTPGEDKEKGDFKDVLAKRRALEERKRAHIERQDNHKRQFEAFRTNILLIWIFANVTVAVTVSELATANSYLPVLFLIVAAINMIRLAGCLGHMIYVWTAPIRGYFFESVEGDIRISEQSYQGSHYLKMQDEVRSMRSGPAPGSIA
ncbi:TPA: hypothetical protein N0F65_010907 [Lagenidium giganteum]|uniref:chitin synthase n=1 Tax=Lagenidium giganteum TaxID=4803 RepID=A0AAV2Z0L5_9STRA|nr:TPA: hypothetical protein N0F65_010907 [Lagenidium giganteum]